MCLLWQFIWSVHSSSFRFTEKKSITINSPSNTLHVSSLKRDICNEQTLFDIFSKYGEIEYVHILKQSMDKRMALVKFYSIEDSFRAVGALHNEVFSGRKMQISFTKPRNWWFSLPSNHHDLFNLIKARAETYHRVTNKLSDFILFVY